MVVSNRNFLFQGFIFRGELLVSGRVFTGFFVPSKTVGVFSVRFLVAIFPVSRKPTNNLADALRPSSSSYLIYLEPRGRSLPDILGNWELGSKYIGNERKIRERFPDPCIPEVLTTWFRPRGEGRNHGGAIGSINPTPWSLGMGWE